MLWKRSEKAEKIFEQLEGFYPTTPIPLDLHQPPHPWVAVLLSAQTILRGNEVTPAFFKGADNPKRYMLKCSGRDSRAHQTDWSSATQKYDLWLRGNPGQARW